MAIDEAANRLAEEIGAVRRGSEWAARCPLHDDKVPSMTFRAATKSTRVKVMFFCHACGKEAAANIYTEMRRRYPGILGPESIQRRPGPEVIRYEIRDVDRVLRAVHKRIDLPHGYKKMWWERPGGQRGLGGTPTSSLPLFGSELLAANPKAWVIITEGEKAALAARRLGLLALGTVTGAASCPDASPLECLRDRRVILWPDADEAGYQHMARLAEQLHDVAGVGGYVVTGSKKGADAADFTGRKEDLRACLRYTLPHFGSRESGTNPRALGTNPRALRMEDHPTPSR